VQLVYRDRIKTDPFRAHFALSAAAPAFSFPPARESPGCSPSCAAHNCAWLYPYPAPASRFQPARPPAPFLTSPFLSAKTATGILSRTSHHKSRGWHPFPKKSSVPSLGQAPNRGPEYSFDGTAPVQKGRLV